MAIDVELKTLKQNNTSWPLTFKASNRFPIVANRVFATLENAQQYVDDTAADASAYAGIVLAVIQDTIAKNNGVYYVQSVAMAEGEKGTLVKVGGTETETAVNYTAALSLSKTLVVGQLIKVENEEKIGEETYQKGFYIVEGNGVISALATSTGSDDEVGALKARVTAIEADYVTTEELTNAIPDVPVQDVKYSGESLLNEDGIADLSELAKTSDLDAYVSKDGYVAYTAEEKEKLAAIAKGAEVNVIENVQVNGVDLTITDKAVNIDLTNYITKDGDKVLSDENYTAEEKKKLAAIAEGAEVNYVKSVGNNLSVSENGELTVDLSSKVNVEGYVAYSEVEKAKLAGIAEGAQVNYVKSVGDNLSVDENGKLTVTIPNVEVPFQSVAENDKVLTLNEGVLSSTLSYTRENVDGIDSLVLKGVNNEVIGSVPVADFVADGMLESVTPVEGTNKFLFTFKTGNGTTKSFEVDFSKYVDTYYADGETIELGDNNTFKVKENVFDAYGAADAAEAAAKEYANTELDKKADKATTLSGYGIVDAYTKEEVNTELAKKAEKADFDTVSAQVTTNKEDINTLKTNVESLEALIGDRAEGDNESIFEKLATLSEGKANKATTLSGYNITDAYTKEEADDKFLTGITIDEELNETSTNAIQNTVVYNEFNNVRDEITSAVTDINTTLTDCAKKTNVNTLNDLALYSENNVINVEIAAGSGTTVTTDTTNNVITIDTKISEVANNILIKTEDGLFVQAILVEGDDVEKLEN